MKTINYDAKTGDTIVFKNETYFVVDTYPNYVSVSNGTTEVKHISYSSLLANQSFRVENFGNNRPCNCGSGQSWVSCSKNSQYCG